MHGKILIKVEKGIDRLKKQYLSVVFKDLAVVPFHHRTCTYTVCDSEELSPTQSIPTMQDKLSDANATIGAARNRD